MVNPIVVFGGFLLMRGRLGVIKKKVMVVVNDLKGEQLTKGNTDGGVITQPTYQMVSAKVEKPPSKIVYSTDWKHIDNDSSKPKIKYGIVYYSAVDDGWRTYSYKDTEGKEQKKTASVYPYREGYYMAHYVKDTGNDYSGTGVKNWFVLNPDNRNYKDNEADAIDAVNQRFDAKTDTPTTPEEPPNMPPPVAPENPPNLPPPVSPPTGNQPDTPDAPDVPPISPPSLPDIGGLSGRGFNSYFNVGGGL